eukprot:scaffold16895_cov78-Skeletonema_dohrnii-CCMP3373.AAC.1
MQVISVRAALVIIEGNRSNRIISWSASAVRRPGSWGRNVKRIPLDKAVTSNSNANVASVPKNEIKRGRLRNKPSTWLESTFRELSNE